MKKSATAVKYGDPIPVKAEKPRGTVILTFVSLARRVQEALGREGRWLVTVETPRNHWSEALQYTCYEAELKDNGRVKLIDDLESFSRELSLIDDCERCFGPGFGAD